MLRLSLENKLCRATSKRGFAATKVGFLPCRGAKLDILKAQHGCQTLNVTSENVCCCCSYSPKSLLSLTCFGKLLPINEVMIANTQTDDLSRN